MESAGAVRMTYICIAIVNPEHGRDVLVQAAGYDRHFGSGGTTDAC